MSDILPFTEELSKRMIADALRVTGQSTVFIEPINRKLTYYEALSKMLWQGAVEGVIYFADGTTLKIEEMKDGAKFWLDLVKFMSAHIDGSVGNNAQVGTMNVFKVYQGIDPDRV